MVKTNKKKSDVTWYKELDEVAVSEALDEATVDAKDASEQHSGLFYAIAEEMQFLGAQRQKIEPTLATRTAVSLVPATDPFDDSSIPF